MSYKLKLPTLGQGIFEAQVIRLHVKEGDAIREGDVVADMETDKASGQLASPTTGTIESIVVKVGDILFQGETIAIIDDGSDEVTEEAPTDKPTTSSTATQPSGAHEAAPSEQKSEPGGTQTDAQTTSQPAEAPTYQVVQREHSVRPEAPAPNVDPKADPESPYVNVRPPQSPMQFSEDADTIKAMPAVYQYAAEHDIDLSQIPVNEDGFVTMEMLEYVISHTIPSPPAPFRPIDQFDPGYTTRRNEEEERRELTYIRKYNASEFEMSHNKIPPFTLFADCDITPLKEALRMVSQIEADDPTEQVDSNELLIPYYVKAIVATCQRYPALNASLDDGTAEFVFKDYYRVGIDINTVQGLFTPVIREADGKGLLDIHQEFEALKVKSISKQLEYDQFFRATVTLSDLSALGDIQHFVPIIHYPQTAIFGIGTMKRQPVVADNGEIVAKEMLPLSLVIDSRVIDRKDAVESLLYFKSLIEEPVRLLYSGKQESE